MQSKDRRLQTALRLHNQGDLTGAAKLYQQVLRTSPDNRDALHFLALVEAASGNMGRAKALMERSLQAAKPNVQFIENFAAVLHRAREFEPAVRLCLHGLQFSPVNAGLLHISAAALLALNRTSQALDQLDRLLLHHPDHFAGHFLRGSALARLNQHPAALASFDKALALNPQLAEAHLDKGTIFFAGGRHADALSAYDSALALRPDFAEAWLGRGHALKQLRRREDALAAYDRALTLRSDCVEAWVGRGDVLVDLARFEQAEAAYAGALRLTPELAVGWLGRGNLMLRLARHEEAAAAFDRALQADPALAEAWLGRGTLLYLRGRLDDALAAYNTAIHLKPALASAWIGQGEVFYIERRYEEALLAWTNARQLDPEGPGIVAACLRARMHICDWAGYDIECQKVRSAVENGGLVAPFTFLTLPSTAAEQLTCARRWVASNFPQADRFVGKGERNDNHRIKITYLSNDFGAHAVSVLIAGLFEQHDRSRFEITALSVGSDDGSNLRQRIMAAAERFVDAASLRDDEMANLIREMKTDVLVDLNGLTLGARTGVFALRPAPVQVSYLGYPGTTGADYFDYVIADRVVIPKHQRQFYSEKVVYLPGSYMVNDDRRAIAQEPLSRAELSLPQTGFVFCGFNNAYKLTPTVFDIWMRILRRVEGSILWLSEDNARATESLRREAALRGVDAGRLVFAPRLPCLEDHLARHRCADLFLDTFPYNAHTTAADALWAGLPVLTLAGETFAGRVAASLLAALDMPEAVAATPAAYETLAVELASDPGRLEALTQKLARNRRIKPLFDTALFTRGIEAAYVAMHARHQAGLPPVNIEIPETTPGGSLGVV